MKLTSVFESQLLEEGLKFGRKEIALVNKIAREVKLGFEWEYHVDKELLQQSDRDFDETEVHTLTEKFKKNEIQRQKIEWTSTFIENQMDSYNVENGTNKLNTIKTRAKIIEKHVDKIVELEDDFEQIMGTYDTVEEIDDDDDKKVLREYANSVADMISTFSIIVRMISELEKDDQLDMWVGLIDGGNSRISKEYDDVRTNSEEFWEWGNKLVKTMRDSTDYEKMMEAYDKSGSGFYVELYPTQQWLEYVMSLSGDDGTWDHTIRSHYTFEAVSEWDEQMRTHPEAVLGFDPDTTFRFWDEAHAHLAGDGNAITNQDYVDYITEVLQDNRNPWGINSDEIAIVKIEAALEDGVETISKPLKLHDGMSLNEQMFDHIQDVGFTTEATGLHVNVSLKGMNFKRDNFNPVKMLLLLNPKMLQEFFQLRGYVEDQFSGMNFERIFNIAGERNARLQIQHFEELAFKTDKHHQVNFNNFISHTDSVAHQDRIEFRYIGGKDYEHRLKTIEWHIYRMVYLTVVAFSEGFAQKEYLKEVYRILDVYSKEHYNGMTFQEIVEWRKRNPQGQTEELNQYAMVGKRNTLDKKISRKK